MSDGRVRGDCGRRSRARARHAWAHVRPAGGRGAMPAPTRGIDPVVPRSSMGASPRPGPEPGVVDTGRVHAIRGPRTFRVARRTVRTGGHRSAAPVHGGRGARHRPGAGGRRDGWRDDSRRSARLDDRGEPRLPTHGHATRRSRPAGHAGHTDELRAPLRTNGEVSCAIGYGHRACPGPGHPAPVMQQLTYGLDGCLANPWPAP